MSSRRTLPAQAIVYVADSLMLELPSFLLIDSRPGYPEGIFEGEALQLV